MDTTAQIVLVIMMVVLGVTLTVVGVMLFLVLKDLRESIQKTNVILNDFEVISKKLATGSVHLDDILLSVKSVIEMVKNQAASPIGSIFGLVNLVRSFWPGKSKGGEY